MESLTTALASLSSRDVFLMEVAITVLLLLVLLARYKLWRIRRLLAAWRAWGAAVKELQLEIERPCFDLECATTRLHEAKAARAVYEQRLREVGFVPKAPRCRNTPSKPQPPAP